MSKSKTDQIIERVYKDHSEDLIKWALRRFKSKEDAEDLCSEVMSRFTKMVIAKEAASEEISDPDKFLWGIAYNLMNDYFRDSARRAKLVEGIEADFAVGTQFIASENELETEPEDDTDTQMKKLRISISQLDYNLREAMIMFHLEKKPLSEISERLKVTESYVKKLLHESKQKIRENDKKNLYEVDKVFRPNSAIFSISGKLKDSTDDYIFSKIHDSLGKQNICLACYEQGRSVEELAKLLGLPSAYIEFDLKWLLEHNFLIKQKNKYLTTFFIYNGTFDRCVINVFFKHKERCLDKIVRVLTAHHSKIKDIGFLGCDKPLNQLLWMMIYTFTMFATHKTYEDVNGHSFEIADEKLGEPYHFIAIFNTTSKVALDPLLMEQYKDLRNWENSGNYGISEDGFEGGWGFYRKHKKPLPCSVFYSAQPSFNLMHYGDFLYRLCKANLRIDDLGDDDSDLLKRCIEAGLISLSKSGTDTINGVPTPTASIIPNFYLFTPSQRERYDSVLVECFEQIKTEMRDLYLDLRSMCKECLPKQIESSVDYASYLSLGSSCFMATVFAYYDGALYVPEDTDDYSRLTFYVTTGGSS